MPAVRARSTRCGRWKRKNSRRSGCGSEIEYRGGAKETREEQEKERKKESERTAGSFAKAEKGFVDGEGPTRGEWNAWNRKQDDWREREKKTNDERRAA